jgi:YVTN family beta-propeller protein
MRGLLLLLASAGPALAGSSNSLLDVSPDGRRLLVANTDSGTVTVVDLASRTAVVEIAAGDHPEGVSWVGDGPLALATVYGEDAVLLLDTAAGTVVHRFAVADEPYGVVTTKDGKFAYVSHDHPGTVSELDLAARTVRRTFKAAPGARGIALSADEATLYVAEFFTAALVAVDRTTGTPAGRWTGHGHDNLCRQVVVHPRRPKAYLPHIRSRVTHHDARGSIFPQLSFCDLDKTGGGDRRRSTALDSFNGLTVVTTPWEVAVSPDGRRLYSVYSGTDDMNVSAVLDDDYKEVEAIGRLRPTGKHPRAVRVNPVSGEVYVYNTLDFAVAVHPADLSRTVATIPVCTPPHSPAWRRGKELFQTAKSPMGSARWIACASCHPDGLTDGRTWANPEGLRKTPSLFGMAHTFPLHWSGDRDESQDFEYTVRGKLMQGRGLTDRSPLVPRTGPAHFAELEQPTAGLSADLDALAVYTNSFPVRLSPHNPAPGELSESAARGKELFFGKSQCATCHSGPYYTDSTLTKPFKRHDVGTGGGADERVGPRYDTPTLLGVYRQPTLLHDGRAKSIREVLTVHNPGDRHGITSGLTADEVDDLAAFVKALPYEMPPDRTPNTVPHAERLAPVTAPRRSP